MPYSKKNEDGSFKVITNKGKKNERVHSKHTTKAKAEAQVRLMRAVDNGWKPTHKEEIEMEQELEILEEVKNCKESNIVKVLNKLDEKWGKEAEIKHTGQYSDKTIDELESMLAKIEKSGPHKEDSPEDKKRKQIQFAIRAKKNWKGGV